MKFVSHVLSAVIALGFIVPPHDESSTAVRTDPSVRRATVELRIGGADETRDAYLFSAVSGLAVDVKGDMLVADWKENNVRVFSPKGAFLFAIGRRGAGPGDLDSPQQITVAKDGLLWVKDAGNHRFSVFAIEAPQGRFVRTIPSTSNYGSIDRIDWDSRGHLVDVISNPPKPGAPFRTVRLYLDSAGAIVSRDTAPPVPSDSIEQWTFRTKSSESNYSRPFGARRIMAYGGRGLAAYAISSNYAVSLVDEHGKQIALLRRSVPAISLSAGDKARIDEQERNIARQNNVSPTSLNFDRPKVKPVISNMAFDYNGNLWVERAVIDGQPHEADVYDRTGRWVAIMQWPANVDLSLCTVSGDTGIAVARDADDVMQVVRLRFH